MLASQDEPGFIPQAHDGSSSLREGIGPAQFSGVQALLIPSGTAAIRRLCEGIGPAQVCRDDESQTQKIDRLAMHSSIS